MKSFLQSIFNRKLAATCQVTILLDMEEHQPALKGKRSRCVKHPLPGLHAHNWSQLLQVDKHCNRRTVRGQTVEYLASYTLSTPFGKRVRRVDSRQPFQDPTCGQARGADCVAKRRWPCGLRVSMLTGVARACAMMFMLILFSFKSLLTGASGCRLVEGSSLNKLVVDMNPSRATHVSLRQHEQQVMEIAAQLMQVCGLRWILIMLGAQCLIL